MQVHSPSLIVTALTLVLLTACGKRAENESVSAAPPQAYESAKDAQGTTTNFEEQPQEQRQESDR